MQAFRASDVAGDPAGLADEWRDRLWPVVAAINKGTRPWANFDEIHLATLGDLLAERGTDLTAVQRSELVDVWHRLDPWDDVRDGLERLRRRHATAVLSNGHLALLVDLTRHGDLRFDCLISAESVRAYKPAREVYENA